MIGQNFHRRMLRLVIFVGQALVFVNLSFSVLVRRLIKWSRDLFMYSSL